MQDYKTSVRFIERCYKLYEQKMYKVAYSILRDEGMAEDAVQEAFLKIMKSDTYFQDVKSDECKRYIITVIKHASITIYNKRKREQEVLFLSEDENDIAQPEKQVDAKKQELDELIERLPEKYYEVVDCLVRKDLSVKETAHELSITESNVRKRFERAKALLKTFAKGSDVYEENRAV